MQSRTVLFGFVILVSWIYSVRPATITNCDLAIVGAGIGGVYPAWRLTNASYVAANKVCIFEKTNRVGGRQYSVRNVFPVKSSVDIGAHRFDPNVHKLMDFIIRDLLKLNTSCYSKTSDCVDNGATNYFLRNRYNLNLTTSDGLPYNFLPSEQWGPGHVRTSAPDPVGDVLNLFPFIANNYNNLVSTDDSIRYPAIQKVMKKLQKKTVLGGFSASQLSLRSATNYSSEFWSFLLDTNGESQIIIDTSLYDFLRDVILNLVNDPVGERLLVITDGNGNEIGYATSTEQLLNLVVSKGARIYYNYELVSIYRDTTVSTSAKLVFANGDTTIAKTVFLNIPTTSMFELSHDSIIFTGANATVRQAMNLFIPQAAVKMYGYYDNAWWKTSLDMVDQVEATTNELRSFDLIDGSVECTSTNTCKGFVQMAYPDGENTKYFETVQQNKDSPLVIIYSNTSDLVQLNWLKDAHYLFVNSMANFFQQKGLSPWPRPLPSVVVMGVWSAAWHYGPVNNFIGGQTNILSLQPVPGMNLFWANECNGIEQGWADGSVIQGEKGCRKLGLSRPTFFSPYWYNAMVVDNI